MRERVHHPAGMRELLQLLKVPRDERPSFKRHINRSSRRAISFRSAAIGSACPKRWTCTSAGCRRTRPDTGSSSPERPLESAAATSTSPVPHLNEAMHGDRVVARIERDQGRRPRRRPRHPHPRARQRIDHRPLRPRRERHGICRAVRSPRAHGHLRAAGAGRRRRAGRDGGGRDHAVADVDPRRARPRRRRARRHRRAGRRHRNHHPQVRHPGRALGRTPSPRPCVSAAPSRAKDISGRTDFRERPDGHDRRRARARFRRRDHDRAAAERPLLARRAHRRRLALRPGGQRARSRSVRTRHVGVFPRARRPHVSVRARDRAVQPQPARRSARAVVPDGSRPPRPGRPRTSSTTA